MTAIPILPDSPYDLANDSDQDEEVTMIPRPGDKVMIYGLKNREELNHSYDILLQFDHEAQRGGEGADGLWFQNGQAAGYQTY